MLMVTYSDLIQIGILIVSIITLFFQVNKKAVITQAPNHGGYFLTKT